MSGLFFFSTQGKSAPNCAVLFQSLWAKSAIYRRDFFDTYGLRLVLKDVSAEENKANRRLGGLLVKSSLGEGSIPEKVLSEAQIVGGASEPLPAQEVEKYKFDFFGGIDHLLNIPVRNASRGMAKAGLIKKEKQLTQPVLFALSAPLLGLVPDVLNHLSGNTHRQSILGNDFRFKDLLNKKKAFNQTQAELKNNLKTGGGTRWAKQQQLLKLDEARKKFEQSLDEAVDHTERWYEEWEKMELGFGTGYRKAKNERDIAELDRIRVQTLSRSPLFADLPSALNIEGDGPIPEEKFSVLEKLVANRERLFKRYFMIPTLIAGGANLKKLVAKSNGIANEIADMKNSSVYKVALAGYQQKKITFEQFQRTLMKDSFWELDRFGAWKLLGMPRPQNELTGHPLTPQDISRDILDDLKMEMDSDVGADGKNS